MEPKTHVKFTDTEKNAVNRLRVEVEQARQTLTDTAYLAYDAGKKRDAAAEAFHTASKKLEERINDVAKDNGVDLTAPNAGRWNFDLSTMELTRLDVPSISAVPNPIPASSQE